jgi:hypothetical protein
MADLEVLPVPVNERQQNNNQHNEEIYKPALLLNRRGKPSRPFSLISGYSSIANLPRLPFPKGD